MSLRDERIMKSDGQGEPQKLPISLFHCFKLLVGYFHAGWWVGSARNTGHFDRRIRKIIVILKDGLIASVPVRHLSTHVHAEGFVTFLKTAGRKVFECVDILTEDEASFLTDSQRECRNKLFSLDISKGRFATHRIHQEFTVQRETWTKKKLYIIFIRIALAMLFPSF